MPDNDDDIYTLRRKRKHAKAQAASAARRKEKGVPRRDDLSRAAYYVTLTLFRNPKIDQAMKAAIQTQMMALLRRAGFSVFEANAAFLNDSTGVLDDINEWLARRWHEQGKHLGEGGKPYRRITGKRTSQSAADKE